jgi:hypothetical protein
VGAGVTNGDNLGVSCGIIRRCNTIPASADDLAIFYYNSAEGTSFIGFHLLHGKANSFSKKIEIHE